MERYVYFTRFELNPSSGGGCRRFVQLHEILKERFESLEVVSARAAMASSFSDKVLYAVGRKGYMTGGDYAPWADGHREHVYALTFAARRWVRLLRSQKGIKTAFVDDPIYFAPLVKHLVGLKVPVVAICHNLESLSAAQVKPAGQMTLLKKELELLSLCAAVITISREEDFLLGNMGINSCFFPYYPVAPILERLKTVREKRRSSSKKGLLALGTVFNAPTRDGIEKLIAFWNRRGNERAGEKLLIAGYGTDSMKDQNSKWVEVLGPLEEEDLDGALTSVKACICYQEKGAGALTKIPEMLIAGVPVIANSRAARTYYNTAGIHEFHDFESIGEVFDRAQDSGDCPAPVRPDKAALLNVLSRLSF